MVFWGGADHTKGSDIVLGVRVGWNGRGRGCTLARTRPIVVEAAAVVYTINGSSSSVSPINSILDDDDEAS